MNLKAGLGGHAVINHTSEIKIRLFSTLPLKGKLKISDAKGTITLPVQLDEHREKIIWLPIIPFPHKPIHVRLLTGQQQTIAKKLTFELSLKPLTIISSAVPISMPLPDKHQPEKTIIPVLLTEQELPHSIQAYNSINAIVSNKDTLSRLSDEQYRALSGYLSQCGTLLLQTGSQKLLKNLQDNSGCLGKFIHHYTSLDQIAPVLLKLSTEQLPRLPGLKDLMRLQKSPFQQQMLISLILYFSGYILLILLLTWRIKQTHYVLFLPFLIAGAGTLVWTGSGNYQLVSWAETLSGGSYSRVSSLLLLGGNRTGNSKINVGMETRIVNPLDSIQSLDLRYQKNSQQRIISAYTSLLSPQLYQLLSVHPISVPFSIKLNNNIPEVSLMGEVFPENARLLWRGNTYIIPKLNTNTSWQPDTAQAKYPDTHEERLLNRRLAFDAPAILLPITRSQNNTLNNHNNSSWLVIRHNPGHSS